MKWEDLEPGDVIRFTDNLSDYFYNNGYCNWCEAWCYNGLLVKEVKYHEEYISVSIKHLMHGILAHFFINYDGSGFAGFEGFNGQIFEVISLNGEPNGSRT